MSLNTTVSYTAMIRESGHEPGETVIAKGVRIPTELERKLLDLAEGEHVIEVERAPPLRRPRARGDALARVARRRRLRADRQPPLLADNDA
jgi:hypothetical protein